MSARTSVLVPEPQPLWLPLFFAVVLHVTVFGMLVLLDALDLFHGHKPLIDPHHTMEVSLVQVKTTKELPTRATMAPVTAGEKGRAKPPPVRQSDLKFEQKRARKSEGQADAKKMKDALAQIQRQLAIQQALEGAKNREATDPNSKANETIQAGVPGATRADPALAKYMASVEALFNAQFKPLKPVVDANPGIEAQYNVDFDPKTGKVLRWSPYKPSGNRSYDAAVERAIEAVPTVPLPPAKFTDQVGSRFTITFLPP